MSLIEEALRRMQHPLTPEAAKAAPPVPSGTARPAESPAQVHPWPSTPSTATLDVKPKPQTSALFARATTGAAIALTAVLIGWGGWWVLRIQPSHQATAALPAPAPSLVSSLPAQTAAVPATQPPEPTPPAPAKRPAPPAAARDAIALTGVVEGLGAPYAMINGLIVGIGDPVGEMTLVQISRGVVTLQNTDGTTVTLRVPQ